MKKYGLWIVLTLVFAGIILGTLGTWSVPLGHGISAFWPAFVVQVAGSAWFGGWGVLAAVLFPVLTNALTNVGWSGILGFIPANLAQGLIPAWAFRHFHVDPALPGRKGLAFYLIWGALIPATVGGLLGSVAVILFGEASWRDYPLLVMKWAAPNLVVSLLIGIPILRGLTPLWRDLGLLVKNWWSFDQASGWLASPRHFRDMPIQLKLALAMCATGLGPLLVLSLLELARNGGNSAPGNMTPFFLTISLVALVLAVGFLSRETVRPLKELQEQVEALVQQQDGVLIVERADEIGQLGRAFAFLLDDRCRAEASLQASEEKYRTLVENLNVGIFQSTLNGTFLHANSALIHLAGYDTWEEFKRLPALRLYADKADRERLITGLMAQGRVWNVELRSVKKDGANYWIALSAVLLKDNEGKPVSILGSVVDITERKQAEEKLATSEAELRALFATMTDVVIVYDADGRYVKIAPTNPINLYRPPADMLGKTVHEVLPKEQADYIVAKIGEAIQTGRVVTGEYALQIGGEEIWFAGNTSRLSENTAVWVAHNITERKRAEDNLHRLAVEQSALYALGREVSASLSLEHLVTKALDEILKSIHADVAYFFLREGERLILKGIASESDKAKFEIPEHRVGECMCGLTITHGKALYSRDIFTDARCTWEECKKAGFRSFATLPLWRDGEIIGVIGLASTSERDFENEAEFLETVADGLPKKSPKYGVMAAKTRASTGVVAA